MLGAKEVWVMDALSAEHNAFHEHVGRHPHVHYIQVNDFECRALPEDHFDYMFSFGCLCHVSPDGIREYARNLWTKLRPGANCFWMVADYEKFNTSIDDWTEWHPLVRYWPRWRPLGALLPLVRSIAERGKPKKLSLTEDLTPRAGRWYHAGTEATKKLLEVTGYQVVDPDIGLSLRDPIIHFRKPR
jgi:hypothetical protein